MQGPSRARVGTDSRCTDRDGTAGIVNQSSGPCQVRSPMLLRNGGPQKECAAMCRGVGFVFAV